VARVLGSITVVLLIAWVVAHMLYLGPVREAAEVTVAWIVWLAAASGVVAALTVLAFGLLEGRSSPAWLRFVQTARTAAAVIGSAVVIIGLLHYRDTEPHGEVRWIVLGLAVLVGAGVVHWWVLRAQRRML
jgi:hypothetical protein